MNNGNTKHYHSTIIVSACIMAAALLTGVLLITSHQSTTQDSKPSESSVRHQFKDQFRAGFQGKAILLGEGRTFRKVDITDMRYHSKQDLILVEFALYTDPPTNLTGSCILSDDGFRRYTGEWGRDEVKVRFLIK